MNTQSAYTEIGTYRIPEWTFADRVRKARLSVEMDQKTFAQQIGKTSSAVAQWEAGNSRPRDIVNVAKSIEMLTRIPASWILGVDAPNAPEPANHRTLVPKVAGSTPVGGTLIPFPTRAGAALDRERLAPVTTLSQKRGA